MYIIKNYNDFEKLHQLVSLQNQVKTLRLQDKLGKQDFHEDVKKVFETATDIIEDVTKEITKTMSETSKERNKAKTNLNDNF